MTKPEIEELLATLREYQAALTESIGQARADLDDMEAESARVAKGVSGLIALRDVDLPEVTYVVQVEDMDDGDGV